MAVKTALDKDLKKYSRLEQARYRVGRENFNLGLGVLFLLCVLAYAVTQAADMPVTDNQDGYCDKLRCENPSEYTWGDQELCSWHGED